MNEQVPSNTLLSDTDLRALVQAYARKPPAVFSEQVFMCLQELVEKRGVIADLNAVNIELSRANAAEVSGLKKKNEHLCALLELETAALEQACAAPVDAPLTLQQARAAHEPCPGMPTVARLDSMFAGDDLPPESRNVLSVEVTKEQWQSAKAELIARRHGLTAEQVSNARESLLEAVAERVRAAQPPGVDVEAIATKVVRNVCELPDYNSPDDQPELLTCTTSELHAAVVNALEGHALTKEV